MRRTLLAVALLLGVALPAAPSGATTYYDYWGYWHKPPGQSAWQYSKVGSSGYYLQPDQPQVEGWRFAVGTASPSDPQPRPTDAMYDDYCKDANTGKKYRALLVVDYGTQSGAPKGPVYSCYGSDTQPNGFTVLDTEHPNPRESGGLICAIDNYPKSGCGDVVSSPAPKPTHSTTTTNSAAPTPIAPPSHRVFISPAPSADATATAAGASPRPTTAVQATATTSATASPSPTDSTAVVATPFVAPRRHGGVPYGFVAACVFVVAVVGAVLWQRRRRVG